MVKPIQTEQQYQAALEKVDQMMQHDLSPGSRLFNELDLLNKQLERYEKERMKDKNEEEVEEVSEF